MNRRQFVVRAPFAAGSIASAIHGGGSLRLAGAGNATPLPPIDADVARDWLARWEKRIVPEAQGSRYCDKEMGEELGWLASVFLNGFHQGYRATGDSKWVGRLVDWTDSCLKRAVTEPDGFPGWPKGDGGGNESTEYSADSLLGEAMMLRPVILMAEEIIKTPSLSGSYGDAARRYLELSARIFEKWDSRGCWREVSEGGLWVVPQFGIDVQTKRWSAGYSLRSSAGFSNPPNKQNHIARWLLAMHDVTGKLVYLQRAEQWFRLMKSRMKTRENGKYFVWNYWDPAGRWDYKPDGSPKHWVGVHPNGGYYAIDAEGIVDAFEHGLVFSREDLDRLIATNRDFMWNHELKGAKFRRVDGGEADPRWKNSPGVLWTALVPHDATLREVFVANHDPASWGGLATTPWAVARLKA